MDGLKQAALIEWFLNKVKGTEFDSGDRHINIAVTGDKDNWGCATFLGEAAYQIDARETRHAHIGNHAIKWRRLLPGNKRIGCGKTCHHHALSLEI